MLGLTRGASCSTVLGASCSFLEVVDRGWDVVEAAVVDLSPGSEEPSEAGKLLCYLVTKATSTSHTWLVTVLPPSTGVCDSWAVICFSHCSAVLKEDHKVITLPELMK